MKVNESRNSLIIFQHDCYFSFFPGAYEMSRWIIRYKDAITEE
jgi:hypothetical protein